MRSPQDVLESVFGYKEFRPLQKDIINHVRKGNDAVVLMPTGGGKSLCYQIPAILNEGLTLVISPLIALMQDQVQRLQQEGVKAAAINSMSSQIEKQETHQLIQNNQLKLLYISPEKVFSANFLNHIRSWNIQLVAIDEAHCVSSWGHHFRPEYSRLSELRDTLNKVPFIALTATADKAVRADIGELLHLNDPEYFISSFDRPNLSLQVLPGRKKWEQIRDYLENKKGQSGIIYCLSRKSTEKIAAKLNDAGHNARYYHAGLETHERYGIQHEFINDQLDIICATIAFGMGIDKSNIRYVIHLNMPGNLESYYQEIGRAGRDGKPADTIMFYSYGDVISQQRFIDDIDNPGYKKIRKLKLDRIKQYAEALICRRRILLSYFNESMDEDCGNCDVCENPPNFFNGTRIAQMALSAVGRTDEQLNMSNLNTVLRGGTNDAIRRNNWKNIKTYGVGRENNEWAWNLYIQQLIQLGFLEIDYKERNHLKLTNAARKVLFEGEKVKLVTLETYKKRKESSKTQTKRPEKPQISLKGFDENLYEFLKNMRNNLAMIYRLPSYTIFKNETVKQLASFQPESIQEFKQIKGIGKVKAKKYGPLFLELIRQKEIDQNHEELYLLTKHLYNLGLKKHQIQDMLLIDESEYIAHFAKLSESSMKFQLLDVLQNEECVNIQNVLNRHDQNLTLNELLNVTKGEMDPNKVKVYHNYVRS